MRTVIASNFSVILVSLVCSAVSPAFADDPTVLTSEGPIPTTLSYGVGDVLKLSRARVNEDVILNYIQVSGTIYDLKPTEIVFLRNEGVSDHVVNAMLDSRKKIETTTSSPQTSSATQQNADDNNPGSGPYPPLYDPPIPDTAPPSTVYVIPYPAAQNAFYSSGYYPYAYYRSGYVYGGAYRCFTPVSTVYHFGGRAHFHPRYHHR